MSKETKLGKSRMMNCGEIAFIINYANSNDITVQFKTTGELVKTTYSSFKNGSVKSHFTPSVFGVGYLGNEKTKDENGKSLKSYKTWASMLRRCYSGKYQKKNLRTKIVMFVKNGIIIATLKNGMMIIIMKLMENEWL